MKHSIWGSVLLGSMLLLTGCTSDDEPKQETKEKVTQPEKSSEDNAEDVKVYEEVHSKYENKLNEDLNKAMQIWRELDEKKGAPLNQPEFRKDVEALTESTLTDIEQFRKEIVVPESKKHEHTMYVGFLDETEQAMKNLKELVETGQSTLMREIEIHITTAVTYYDRFKKEEQSAK